MAKYCRKCGKPLSDGAKFCAVCGTAALTGRPVEPVPAPMATPRRLTQKKKPSRKRLLIPAAGILLAAVLLIVFLPRFLGGGSKPAAVSGEPGDLSVFAYSEEDLETKGETLSVSPKQTSASALGATIDFGEYGIQGEQTLTIRKLPEKTDEVNGVKVTAYDFSLGDIRRFEDVITITLPYDESCTEAGAEGECVGARYLNEDTGEWEALWYEVDTIHRQVVIRTTHLSTFGVFQVKNENTRKAYVTDVYAVAGLLGPVRAEGVLRELSETGKPGSAAFEAGFTAINGAVGDFGAAFTAVTLGGQYDSALTDVLGKTAQHAGLALSVVQTLYDITYNFSDDAGKLSTFANLAKNITNNAVGYFGSAAMQLGFAGVYVFDVILSTVQSDMVELKLENIGDVYQYYNDVEAPRAAAEWRRLFIGIMEKNAGDPQRAQQLIEAEINAFCDRFWELDYGKIKEIAGVSGKKYSFDERGYTKDRQVLTAQYKAHLMNRLQAPLTSARNYLITRAMELSQIELDKQLRSLQKELNRSISVQIVEIPEKEGEYRYGGYTVRFAPLMERADEKNWTGNLPDSGTLNTSFTILGHVMSGAPYTVELYEPGKDTPVLTVPFRVTYPVTVIELRSAGEDRPDSQDADDKPDAEPQEPEGEEEFVWVLTGAVEDDGAEAAGKLNEKNQSYRYDVSSGGGSVTATMTFIGATDESMKINGYYRVNGESVTITAGWSSPPGTVRGDELVTLQLSLSGKPTSGWPNANGTVLAQVLAVEQDGSVTGRQVDAFVNKDGKSWFETSDSNGYQSFDETVFAVLPGGYGEGDRIAIRISGGMNGGGKASSTFIYEWRPVS